MDSKEFEILHEKYEILKMSIKTERTAALEVDEHRDCSQTKALLEEMITKITKLMFDIGTNGKNYYRLLAMLGVLYYQRAKVLVRFSKFEEAREILKQTMESLKENFLSPEITFLALRVLNHYCYLLTKFDEMEKAKSLLEMSETQYLKIKASKEVKIFSNDDLFNPSVEMKPSKEITDKFERLVTNNLQMLAFVYSKQGNMEKFTVYHHQVLRRQLDMREGDATVWAMKTARLGYFFMTLNKFSEARHHLAAACYVLSQYENRLKMLETTDLVLHKWEELNLRYADIAKCWVKYGLFLFNVSRLKLLSAFYGDSSALLDASWTNPLDKYIFGMNFGPDNDINDFQSHWARGSQKNVNEGSQTSEGTTNSKNPEYEMEAKNEAPTRSITSLVSSEVFDVMFRNKNPSNVSTGVGSTDIAQPTTPFGSERDLGKKEHKEGQERDFRFTTLDLSCFENCVSCSFVGNLQAARDLFFFTHSWLKKSKMFYTLQDHPMEYINVILDLSELYKYLAFYDDDIENQYSLQKRRADTLETLSTALKELRPQCYVAISIELLRELAEVHLELMSLNLRRLYLNHSEPSKQENTSSSHYFTDMSEEALQKMKTIADMHLRLSKFGASLEHCALRDFESGGIFEDAIQSGDIAQSSPKNVFESYEKGGLNAS